MVLQVGGSYKSANFACVYRVCRPSVSRDMKEIIKGDDQGGISKATRMVKYELMN